MEIKDKLFTELMTALSLMMDLEENRKLYHAWRVGVLAEKMARKVMPEYANHIFYAGLLHDIGAISLPDHMVHYTNPDDHLRYPVIYNHPRKGAEIVREIEPLKGVVDMILDHHEHWDGSGYPRGICGDRISLGGQILRICDTFDVLSRVKPPLDIVGMKTLLAARRGWEFSDLMYEVMVEVLGEGNFFDEIIDEQKIGEMVFKIVESMPPTKTGYCERDISKVIQVFGRVIDAKHEYTAGHSSRVAFYTSLIAKNLGLADSEVEKLEFAAYLHDAGKVAIPRAILDKPGRLTLEEFKTMKRHPVYTMEILSTVGALKDLAPISGHHHEKYDGSGYPDGLSRDGIQLGARIMAVADAFDAMTSARPYQKQKSGWEAKEELVKWAGSQFDPEVVKVAVRVLPDHPQPEEAESR
ncbi:HD-GYP domain-containing protein [Thermosediminibacter oceani]|uniref:Metal dependent phosphohydrolase n=1 Tax=Thermosediminibacter oceani (strain ATCC BAA-1034 / DSM 16646 / JW/IW-1228P) TaxID=555079 RepID=D9RZ87_THEOJ|nr:HD-GYP domain-containing protein [Thermosediminibacter oceani]ADL08641.1 metal dependent phosphohydrolase [Thermosediminibacter oceani DSM 16646]